MHGIWLVFRSYRSINVKLYLYVRLAIENTQKKHGGGVYH
jgi:hypothetical protein